MSDMERIMFAAAVRYSTLCDGEGYIFTQEEMRQLLEELKDHFLEEMAEAIAGMMEERESK